MSYVLVTNIYNEEEHIPRLIENIANQTLRPECWVWIDDGSTDKGLNVAIENAKRRGLPIATFQLPPKRMGKLDTIGRAWNKAHGYIINNLSADYLSVADVDTEFPLDYFERMVEFMNQNPEVGVSSGRIEGDPHEVLRVPMGLGKMVRWKILQSFNKYWDLAPDSFFNIKAQRLGYKMRILDIYVKSAAMTILSEKGRYRYGRRSYYIGKHPILVGFEALKLLFSHQHATEFLRGYWSEWGRGKWRCDDPDVLYIYSLRCQIDGIQRKMGML